MIYVTCADPFDKDAGIGEGLMVATAGEAAHFSIVL